MPSGKRTMMEACEGGSVPAEEVGAET